MSLLFTLVSIGTIITIINAFTMRIVKPQSEKIIRQSVAVLIPMRDEEKNVVGVISSVRESANLTSWKLVVLNDGSKDETATLLEAQHVPSLDGKVPPEGWLGKNWACWQMAQSVDSEYLVFLDADVRLQPLAISSSIIRMNELGWDFISPYPRQLAYSFLERLIQPLLQWSWLSSVPLRFAERTGVASMTIANGQFFIIKNSSYKAVEGHRAIKGEVLDDLRLARTLTSAGFKGGVAEGSAVAECRMYDSATQLIEGYTKSLWNAFGGLLGTLFACALLISTQVLPIVLGIAGYSIGWAAYLISSLSHAVAAIRTKSGSANIFMHPLSTLLLVALIIESVRRKRTGNLIWRGRHLT
jgi:glycosyltransferase involved in cell wall biosynthesis